MIKTNDDASFIIAIAIMIDILAAGLIMLLAYSCSVNNKEVKRLKREAVLNNYAVYVTSPDGEATFNWITNKVDLSK